MRYRPIGGFASGDIYCRSIGKGGVTLVGFLLALGVSQASAPATANQTSSDMRGEAQRVANGAEYIGGQRCGTCHQQQLEDWHGSHHDLAMQPASEATVLGDFDNQTFNYFGTVSSFYKKNGRHFVKTDDANGQLQEFPIAYTFGVEPLQQYLIEFSNGHIQALNVVWDTRSREEGGQRWFHLYPDEHIDHNDELHWTGINQNWNFMCADCHSTNLEKNYEPVHGSYNTTWSEIDVSCEACHGPASEHAQWAENKDKPSAPAVSNKGFGFVFDDEPGAWVIQSQTGNAKRSQPRASAKVIEVCAACHSRRATAYPHARPGEGYLDNYQPALLDEPLYHADGQINGEVYVYGSFVQSKMYHAGVTCTDCHNPHSLGLKAQGNLVCAQCHLPDKYDSQNHHLHARGSTGSQCVNCHMPAKNFMVVDARRDHSFRIPRPDISAHLDTPNACNQCHTEQSPEWAAEVLQRKFGVPASGHYAYAIAAGRSGWPDAEQRLVELIMDDQQPEIARATAVTLLPNYISRQSAPVLQMVAQGDDALMSLALARAADELAPEYRPAFAVPLLYEPDRVTRNLAARSLAGVALTQLPDEVRSRYQVADREFLASAEFNSDRPETLTNLGGYFADKGLTQEAKAHYQRAIATAAHYTPAYINLAEFTRKQGDEVGAEQILMQALEAVADKTVVEYSLGLSMVRQQRMDKALTHLKNAANSPSASSRYVYVYAIALHSSGDSAAAIKVLEEARAQFPSANEITSALTAITSELDP